MTKEEFLEAWRDEIATPDLSVRLGMGHSFLEAAYDAIGSKLMEGLKSVGIVSPLSPTPTEGFRLTLPKEQT